ncbi:MAG: efflux transporter outer membrane subunit [Gammaproteobacteria bacterium]|nr:efflux transporter outer membrane subunit [Gammaproteobacteria bacterium]
MKHSKLTQAIMFSLILSGCSLAPQYETPNVPISERWVGVALQEQSEAAVAPSDLHWKEFFTDPRLQKLLETALANNHDLQKAGLNVELVQAQYSIKQANRLPNVGVAAGAKRSRQGRFFGKSNISEMYNVGLGISSFELDFFGRVKNTADAALNKYLATKEARDAAQLSIINAVAKTYYQWRTARALKDLAKQTLHTRQQTYKLTKLRVQEGLASGTDLSSTGSAIAMAESSYQQQLRNVQKAENALATLVGQPLKSLNLPKGKYLTQQFSNKKLFAGVPSQALLKRPDIRQAEYALKSANANIGAARAAMFPIISLTANTGYASPDLGNLIGDPTRLWSIAPSINLPIFDAGKRRAGIKMSEINKKIVIQDYQKAIQAAFQDVSDALIARETLAKQYAAEQRGQAAARQTLRLVKLQVQEGLANGLHLLDAQRADYAIRQAALVTLLNMTNNKVDLYTALGGGLDNSKVKNPTAQ